VNALVRPGSADRTHAVRVNRREAEELEHDFLWRTTCRLPERGRIGIFNRSYYEGVLVVRVHPEILRSQGLPEELRDEKTIWKERYLSIGDLERYLYRNVGSGPVAIKKPCIRRPLSGTENQEVQSRCRAVKKLIFSSHQAERDNRTWREKIFVPKPDRFELCY